MIQRTMKKRFELVLVSGIAVVLAQMANAADNQPAAAQPAATPPNRPVIQAQPVQNQLTPRPQPATPPPYKAVLKDEKTDFSYAWGLQMGNFVKNSKVELDMEVLMGAIKDAMAGVTNKMTEDQGRAAVQAYQMQARTKMEQDRLRMVEKNRQEGDAWLAENKKKDGVKTQSVSLPGGKTVEMQYKVIAEGSGASPKTSDMVTVNYRGTLIGGKEFDNSAKRGQPAKFPVTGVVKGWTEALQMMKVGAKWELYLPADLAYGDRGFGQAIEPGSTLIFEMELVSIEVPPAPAAAAATAPGLPGTPSVTPAQPLTSDIIRVPSAEELKKGAKPEVIKAEDLEKRIKEEKDKAAK